MDVDVDTGDVANQGEQSGVVDVDMREGSMNEHNKAPNKESSPHKMPSPSDNSLSTEKDSPIAGEK
ncbi:hypothetical protein L208DRAFT_1391994 [Tricholoma matsutake]|nr:hypothetical protein L208DRAFT_1391994 [Tricholoma matsutake 945]